MERFAQLVCVHNTYTPSAAIPAVPLTAKPNADLKSLNVLSSEGKEGKGTVQLIRMLLDESGGWLLVLKAFTSLAGKNRDESRLTILISQLRHGLSTNKLHIQAPPLSWPAGALDAIFGRCW